MPSLTYWNRLEPRPKTRSIQRSLMAQVRDPLWFLTRQWQFGEFQGEDAGSPAYVEIAGRFSPLDGWSSPQGSSGYTKTAPLESLVEREPFTPDRFTAAETGQWFEEMLAEADLEGLIPNFRTAYPIQNGLTPAGQQSDPNLNRFIQLTARRVIHGLDLLAAAQASPPTLPADPEIQARQAELVPLLDAYRAQVEAAFGSFSLLDAPTWRAEQLEYQAQAAALTPDGGRATFEAVPGPRGQLDWFAFDLTEMKAPEGETPGEPAPGGDPLLHDTETSAPGVESFTRGVLPIDVRFRGMPHSRWWHFEDRVMNFGDIRADRREIAKVIFIDFMLVHGSDWFQVPFNQPAGSLCQIDRLLVHDVFGAQTLVDRADRGAAPGPARWTMFSHTAPGQPGGLAEFFLLPPSTGDALLEGSALEEVRFLRDEMANMVWAVEHTVENGLGQPWSGQERALGQPSAEEEQPDVIPGAALRYRLMTGVPENWIPFIPVQIDAARRQVALERAAMLRPVPGGAPEPVPPSGRILQPSGLPEPGVYRVREEEISRSGVRVLRQAQRARWSDGTTHLWVLRQKRAGGGEGSSGLAFDLAEPVEAGTS